MIQIWTFSIKKKTSLSAIQWASASTAFATEAGGQFGHYICISATQPAFCRKASTNYPRITLILHFCKFYDNILHRGITNIYLHITAKNKPNYRFLQDPVSRPLFISFKTPMLDALQQLYRFTGHQLEELGCSFKKYLSLSFDLRQILSQSHCSDW